MKLENFIVLCG